MLYRDRKGRTFRGNEKQDRFLRAVYGSAPGRLVLKLLIQPGVSRFCGVILSSRISALGAAALMKKYHMDPSDYQTDRFGSWNEFFRRQFRPEQRPVDRAPDALISPCDGKLQCCTIRRDGSFTIKRCRYSLETLLRNRTLAAEYEGGQLLIFRLTVDDYHRYCYIADGRKSKNVSLPGVFHTVNPAAEEWFPVYQENAREYSCLETERLGKVLMVEVGAMLVGKIVNHHGETTAARGQEKGYFEFGGSTILLAFQKDRVSVDRDIQQNSAEGIETLVRLGERIGTALG